MLNRQKRIMENELFREKIVKEYVKYKKPEKKSNNVWSKEQYIKFYEDNKRSLNSLLFDMNEYFVDNKEKNLIIDKNDEVAINFLNKQINKYERRIEKGRKIIFEDTLIVD